VPGHPPLERKFKLERGANYYIDIKPGDFKVTTFLATESESEELRAQLAARLLDARQVADEAASAHETAVNGLQTRLDEQTRTSARLTEQVETLGAELANTQESLSATQSALADARKPLTTIQDEDDEPLITIQAQEDAPSSKRRNAWIWTGTGITLAAAAATAAGFSIMYSNDADSAHSEYESALTMDAGLSAQSRTNDASDKAEIYMYSALGAGVVAAGFLSWGIYQLMANPAPSLLHGDGGSSSSLDLVPWAGSTSFGVMLKWRNN
jgi:hypothetical protein